MYGSIYIAGYVRLGYLDVRVVAGCGELCNGRCVAVELGEWGRMSMNIPLATNTYYQEFDNSIYKIIDQDDL